MVPASTFEDNKLMCGKASGGAGQRGGSHLPCRREGDADSRAASAAVSPAASAVLPPDLPEPPLPVWDAARAPGGPPRSSSSVDARGRPRRCRRSVRNPAGASPPTLAGRLRAGLRVGLRASPPDVSAARGAPLPLRLPLFPEEMALRSCCFGLGLKRSASCAPGLAEG